MKQHNLQSLIDDLKKDYITYRNKCLFKIQEEKNQDYPITRKCLRCNGISSVFECWDFIDIPHMIKFYEEFNNGKI
jgi:hypothetical protein